MDSKKIIGIVALLLIGGFIGFFTAGRLAKHRIAQMHRIAQEPGREVHRLFHILDLSEEQQEQIRPILEQHMPAHRAIRRNFHHRMDSLRNQMFTQIEPLLRPEQKERLEELRKRKGPMMRRHRPGPGPRPGDRPEPPRSE